jgi:hypothetical protein
LSSFGQVRFSSVRLNPTIGIRVIFKNYMVALCASCACAGGLLFGFDQGLLSVTLVMPQFLAQFPEIDTSVTSGAGLNKG